MNARHTTHRGGNMLVLEVGQDWLKILGGERAGKGAVVDTLHFERLGADSDIAAVVTAAVREARLAGRGVVLCLPRQAVTLRILRLPSADPAEVADMVDLQAGKLTPYSKDEIITDHCVLGTDASGYSSVMVAIAQRAVVAPRVSALEDAGLDVERVAVSSEGVLQWARLSGVDPANGRGVALLDVDSGSSDLLVSRNGMPVFTRSVRIGGEALLGDIAKWGEALGIEVRRALEDCRAETPGLEVDRVLLSGCASSFEGLSALLRKLVNLPVEPADPAQSVRRTPRAPALKDPLYRSLSLTPLLGLVMGGGEATFDLTPETVVLRKRVLRKSRVLSSFGVLLMAALLSLSLLGATAVVAENSRWAHLKAGADAFEEKAAQVERRNAVVKAYGTLANRRSCSVELLADIQRVKPAGIFLTRVEVDEERGRLVLAGSGESRAEISGFVSNLNASRLFRDAKDSGTQTDDNNRFTFQVNASLEAAP